MRTVEVKDKISYDNITEILPIFVDEKKKEDI